MYVWTLVTCLHRNLRERTLCVRSLYCALLVMAAYVCVGSPSLLVLWAGGIYCGYVGVVYYCRVVWGGPLEL